MRLALSGLRSDRLQIVYVRVEGGESWLEIMDLETDATTPLETTRGPASDALPEQPAWSPDGTSIAFNRIAWDGGEPIVGTVHYGDIAPKSGVLSVVNVATGAVADVVSRPDVIPGDANWSPDSSEIWFADGPLSTMGSVGVALHRGIYRIRFGEPEPEHVILGGSPKFTPDGRYVLFQNNELFLMREDETELLPVNGTAMDLTELAQGYVYVAHWLPPKP